MTTITWQNLLRLRTLMGGILCIREGAIMHRGEIVCARLSDDVVTFTLGWLDPWHPQKRAVEGEPSGLYIFGIYDVGITQATMYGNGDRVLLHLKGDRNVRYAEIELAKRI